MEPHLVDFQLPPPDPALRLVTIVPAKNEERTLPATLAALYQQTDPEGRAVDKRWYEVIVLANNCSDATAEVAEAFARAHPDGQFHVVTCQLPPPYAHIGYVRRILMDEAYRRLMSPGYPQDGRSPNGYSPNGHFRRYSLQGVIASTDGDSTVNATWVYHTLKAVQRGADVVGGRIRTNTQAIGRRYYLQDVMYRYLQAQLESIIDPQSADPWPRHFQNFGPSLAVTCELYERAGRLPVLRSMEDVRFYEALQRCDARIRHCPNVQVLTSARTQGRVDFGFSVQLQQWEQMLQQGEPFVVPPADYWAFRFTLQQHLRQAWQRRSLLALQPVAQWFCISPYFLFNRMESSRYFGAFWQWFAQLPEFDQLVAQRFAPVAITGAIAGLRHLVGQVTPFVPIGLGDSGPFVGAVGASTEALAH
ncbi:MAG: glycosyltransferase [Tunicatimonas sp.]